MRWSRLLLALLVASSGCEPSLTQPAGVVAAPSTPSRDAPLVAYVAPPPPRLPAVVEVALEPPDSIACALVSPSWTGELRLSAGGAVYASITGAKTTVIVPRERAAAFVTVDAPLALRGVLPEPRLFLAKPLPLGGFIVPLGDTPLPAPGPHAEGKLSVKLDLDELISDPSSIAQELPCDALTTSPSTYDVRKYLGVLHAEQQAVEISGAALRMAPEQKPIARVSSASNVWVTGGAPSPARRVVLQGSRYFAVGWVAREDVGQRRSRRALAPTIRMGTIGTSYSTLLSCSRDVPVFVQMAGVRALVGAVRAGRGFARPGDPAPALADDEVPIKVPGSWLHVSPGATLFVKASDVAECEVKADPARAHD